MKILQIYPILIVVLIIIIGGGIYLSRPAGNPQESNNTVGKALNNNASDNTTKGEALNAPVNSVTPPLPGNSTVDSSATVDLSGKGLTEFPKNILSNRNIKKLVLSNNSLKSLPSEIGELTNLEELYLDNNLLTGALPAEIRKMPKLRILDAHKNNLTGLPAEIGQLKNLQIVNFSDNGIDTMPNEIANIKGNLQVFNLSGNKYSLESIRKIEDMLPNTQVIY